MVFAGEQHRRAFARELLLAHAPHRQESEARELEQPARAQLGREPGGALHRWDGRRHGIEQRAADGAGNRRRTPATRATVAGGVVVERRRGHLDVGREVLRTDRRSWVRGTDGACRQRSPWAGRSSARMTGDANPSG